MSANDKKALIVKLLQQSKRPYTLKDLEKLAAKAGVVQNTVKDLAKELVDEVRINVFKLDRLTTFPKERD